MLSWLLFIYKHNSELAEKGREGRKEGGRERERERERERGGGERKPAKFDTKIA